MRPRLARPALLAIGAAVLISIQLAGASPASAAPFSTPAQTASLLQASQIVIADDSESRSVVDADSLAREIGGASHIYIAVLPARALNGTANATAADIGNFLDDAAAVVVVAIGSQLGAAQGSQAPLEPGEARAIANNAQAAGLDVQSALQTVIRDVRASASSGSGGVDAVEPANPDGGTGGQSQLLLVLLLLGGLGGFLYLRRRRADSSSDGQVRGMRAEVESLHARLGSDVSLLDPGEDRVARQALADASERFTATGALLDSAGDTPEILAQAKRTAIEGIEAARVVRRRTGLDPGPDPMPPPPPGAPQVRDAEDVEVDGQTYTGYGSYRPGAGNYFGGGYYGNRYIPGGWYAQPFWQSAAISVLAFGGLGYALGGFGMSGGYETEAAYERGFDDGAGNASDGGGGWDGGNFGGGGDFGGGGGFGGGDF